MENLKGYSCCQQDISCEKCSMVMQCTAWMIYVKQHNKVKSYAHFDERVSLQMPSIRKYVTNSVRVAKHGFYPFIHFTMNASRYRKSGLKRKYRELYYCSHLDRCVYQRYAFLINYRYNIWAIENRIDSVAIAYRDNLKKNNIDFAKQAFEAIRSYPQCVIIVGDFTNFFDNLNHKYLKKMICKVMKFDTLPDDYYAVFKNITRFSSWDWKDIVRATGESIQEPGIRKRMNCKKRIMSKEQFNKNKSDIKKNTLEKGIPQGSPISAVLSNVYMIEFDQELMRYVSDNNGIYMRYSDDFFIVIPYEDEKDINKYKQEIFEYIASKKALVELQKEKTDVFIYKNDAIYSYDKMNLSKIDYLGFWFDGKKIKMRPRAITKYYYRMRRKARTIGKCNWISPRGRHISAKNLYATYSENNKRQTFIDYARKANYVLGLEDAEVDALVKHHKRKIAQAIKEGQSNVDGKNSEQW